MVEFHLGECTEVAHCPKQSSLNLLFNLRGGLFLLHIILKQDFRGFFALALVASLYILLCSAFQVTVESSRWKKVKELNVQMAQIRACGPISFPWSWSAVHGRLFMLTRSFLSLRTLRPPHPLSKHVCTCGCFCSPWHFLKAYQQDSGWAKPLLPLLIPSPPNWGPLEKEERISGLSSFTQNGRVHEYIFKEYPCCRRNTLLRCFK